MKKPLACKQTNEMSLSKQVKLMSLHARAPYEWTLTLSERWMRSMSFKRTLDFLLKILTVSFYCIFRCRSFSWSSNKMTSIMTSCRKSIIHYFIGFICFIHCAQLIDGRVAGKVGYNNNYYSGKCTPEIYKSSLTKAIEIIIVWLGMVSLRVARAISQSLWLWLLGTSHKFNDISDELVNRVRISLA